MRGTAGRQLIMVARHILGTATLPGATKRPSWLDMMREGMGIGLTGPWRGERFCRSDQRVHPNHSQALMIPTSDAFLVTTLAQAVLYGLYLATFAQCLRWLLYDDGGWVLRTSKNVNHVMLITAILIFAFTSVDTMVALRISLTQLGSGNGNGLGDELGVVNTALETFTALITDAVLIYRCWSVYGKKWRIICLPLVLWACNIICPVLLVPVYITHQPTSSGISWSSPWMHALQVFYAFNFSINLYATVAIVYRIRSVAGASNTRSSPLHNVCRTVAGTGIMYTFTSLALLTSSFKVAQDPFPFLLCDAINFPMAGITFNLLLIRAGQLRANQTAVCEETSEATFTTLVPHSDPTTTESHSPGVFGGTQGKRKKIGIMR